MAHCATPIDFATFVTRFPQCIQTGGTFAEDITDEESTHFYVNPDGSVGEARMDRATAQTTYSILFGETAEMVVSYYTAKRKREARDNPILAQMAGLYASLSYDGKQRFRTAINANTLPY